MRPGTSSPLAVPAPRGHCFLPRPAPALAPGAPWEGAKTLMIAILPIPRRARWGPVLGSLTPPTGHCEQHMEFFKLMNICIIGVFSVVKNSS